jgi:hypothetical protein
MAVFICQALAHLDIQKLARNADIFYPAGAFILKLLQAAKPTLIAQGFPLFEGHFI